MPRPRTEECGCRRCLDLRGEGTRIGLLWLPACMDRWVLCASCGLPRCPHASDHQQACTRSNAFGQPGSVYQHRPARQQVPPRGAPALREVLPEGIFRLSPRSPYRAAVEMDGGKTKYLGPFKTVADAQAARAAFLA